MLAQPARLLLVLSLLSVATAMADDKTTWRLQFHGEAPCVGVSGKQVFNMKSSIPAFGFPGESDAQYIQDIVDGGGALALTDLAGDSTFDVTGCGQDPIHVTEQASFTFLAYPVGSGIYYVQTNNHVNDYFCGSNTINVTFDPAKIQITGNYVDTTGATQCAVAAAGPGANLPSVDPSQPTEPPPSTCANPDPSTCPLEIDVASTLKDAAEKKYYEAFATASGGKKPYKFQILSSDPPFPLDFPKGLSYKQFGDQFVIYGTPQGNYPDDYIFLGTTFSFRIQVTDSAGHSDTKLTSIRVVPPLHIYPTWRPILLKIATESVPYYDYVYAEGGDDLSYPKHWSLVGGAPPPGIKLDDTSGRDLIFRGKPDPGSRGQYTFQVKLDDGFSYNDTQLLVMNVFSARTQTLRVTTVSLPAVTQNDSVSIQLGAAGGTGIYTWKLTSTAPPGLTLSSQGVLSGHATKGADAAYKFTVQVKDSDGKSASGSITLQINPPRGSDLHVNTSTSLPKAYAGSAFTASVVALGGYAPYAFALDKSSPALPAGLKLSPQGVLSGTATKAQTVNLIFSVKDSKGKTSKATLKLVISGDKAPSLHSLSPESEPVNSAGFTLRVKGNGFVSGAKIFWDDEPLTTQGNDLDLSATVPAELLTLAGTARISVENGTGFELDPLPFAVLSAQPSTLTAPLPGVNLGDSVEFDWIRSTATHYRLMAGDHGVGTGNLFDKTLGSTASSATINNLPLDGRTIYIRLGSQLHDGWHYHDYSFSTVRSATAPRAQSTVTLQFTNSLIYPVDIVVNGTSIGAVKGSSTAQKTVKITPPLMVSIEMERPKTSSGVMLGDEFKGFYSPITNPSKTVSFIINNQIGTQQYFVPIFNNTTASDKLLGVNMQLQAENRCNCVIPAHGSNVTAGYYQLFTNSNVRLYDPANGYSGNYTYWGSNDGTSSNSFASSVEAKTGRLLLTIK